MKKLFAAGIASVMAMSMMLTGCGSGSATGTNGKVELRFATWDNSDDLDAQQALVDDFNKSHDNIEVTLEGYGDEYDTKISAGMGAGDAPDIMYMWNYPAYYKGLEPLDNYIKKEGADFKSNYYDAIWPYNQIDGATYGMPVGFTTHGLYYNKDLFKAAGVAEPTDDWTWDDLQSAAKTITDKVKNVKGFAFQMKPDPYDFEMYLWSNDTAYCSPDGKMNGYLNSDKAVQVFNMFQKMEKDGIAVATEDNGSDEFKGQKVAMYIYGAWAVSSLQKDKMNFGIASIPAFAGASHDSVSVLSSSGVGISKDSKNKDAAWEFVKYWTGEKAETSRIGYELPTMKSVVEAQKLTDDPYNAQFYKMLEQSAGYTTGSFILKNWSEVSDKLSLAFEKIFNPSTLEDPKKALDEALTK